VTLLGDSLPGFATIALALVIAAVFGGFAGFIPGALKATSGAHEVVTTIMLNYVFVFRRLLGDQRAVASAPLTSTDHSRRWDQWRRPGDDQPFRRRYLRPQRPLGCTAGPSLRGAALVPALPDHARLRDPGSGRQLGRGSVCWHEDPPARRAHHVDGGRALRPGRRNHDPGVVHQIAPGYDTTIGFDAITVALLGRSNPIGIALAGLLLGGMRAGSQSMQISPGVPGELVDALQAIILLFLVINMLRRLRLRRHSEGPTVASAEPYGLGAVSTEAAQ